ncbi:PREDICTED: centrosomal protein of 72 kDa isoform X5 [Chinchilla lanigera]|uniref:centrosomal protein of 72 kDa isoform X5 n=1 Tax=Chinchilla lanigera TaxID=34839 RepID=UPI0006967812|nr:PREDICTED: centrosomal protein of 72 kDa isoform X5 [Chinchilla lanigera]
MAPGSRLLLSEETVRERSGLGPQRDLAELQSLSIPGTYQEKITHLGSSLMHLTGLKSLDLSRNSLVSLEGIQYLVSLESLNLYYNCISSLAEVFRLHVLTELQDVDLRLNPVVKNEPDYRLFVLHMLPRLRQLESRHLLSPPSVQHQCGDPLRKGHDKRRASSSTCCPEQPPPHQHCGELSPQHGKPEACCAHSPHIDVITHPDSTDIEDSSSSCQKPSLSSQKVLNPLPVPERYRKRRMHGGRFQMLSNQKCLSHLERASGLHSLTESLSKQDSSGGPSQRAFSLPRASEAEEQTSHSPSISHLTAPLGERAALDMVFLEALLNLVDKYWSGCRSLHGNQAFLAQAKHVLSSVQELASAQGSTAPGDEEVSYLVLENQSLHMRLAEQQQQYTTTMSEVTAELSSTQREMDLEGLPTQDSATLRALPNCYTPRPQDTLRQHLDRSLEENNSLKSMLFNMKKEVKNGETSAALNVQISGLQASVKQLSGEVVELKQHLEHYDKIQELTQMLQESHSSLVSTNEHLLQELSRERAQHRAEVEQMRWSFQELKKTAALFPPHSASFGGCQSC